MRLISPTPGECADRQTILELKVKYGGGKQEPILKSDELVEDSDTRATGRTVLRDASKVNIQPFIDENEQIQRYLEKAWFPSVGAEQGDEYDGLYEQLAELNEQLWKLIDQAHILRDAPDKMQEQANQRAAEVLFAQTDLNDKRAELVRKINGLFEVRVQEKIFA
jgi:hypothetical protein